jgi:hypothetical protein
MIETRNFIDQYWGNAEGIYITAEERHEGRPFGKIRNVKLENIQITGESGVFVYGSKPGHVEGISMKDISVHLLKNSTQLLLTKGMLTWKVKVMPPNNYIIMWDWWHQPICLSLLMVLAERERSI